MNTMRSCRVKNYILEVNTRHENKVNREHNDFTAAPGAAWDFRIEKTIFFF